MYCCGSPIVRSHEDRGIFETALDAMTALDALAALDMRSYWTNGSSDRNFEAGVHGRVEPQLLRELLRERLRATRPIKPPDPWTALLRNIPGQLGHDGIERIATDAVFEQLDIPPLKRTPEAAKRLKLLMVDLGWTPVRSRHVTSRGRAARVRGYARMKNSFQQKPSETTP
jgi:hypothetical protein